ncbi:hypothetical protein PCYB_134710 [Plasmodium cynomolgi strain B]|uniref:Uncharacterized protein n=1 Tax=Plasmodium cynomolgi (strain B) TaxID=1120755 RepID=K6VGY0_PLACD|nr:hypothetical protein PCYB_134710 [Plasmodium cynomolgi strain B]GAB68597.1 hypothetical protein PCYB_134710 [Plasmodium cynomolgi strain B]
MGLSVLGSLIKIKLIIYCFKRLLLFNKYKHIQLEKNDKKKRKRLEQGDGGDEFGSYASLGGERSSLIDSPLSKTGIQESVELSKFLKDSIDDTEKKDFCGGNEMMQLEYIDKATKEMEAFYAKLCDGEFDAVTPEEKNYVSICDDFYYNTTDEDKGYVTICDGDGELTELEEHFKDICDGYFDGLLYKGAKFVARKIAGDDDYVSSDEEDDEDSSDDDENDPFSSSKSSMSGSAAKLPQAFGSQANMAAWAGGKGPRMPGMVPGMIGPRWRAPIPGSMPNLIPVRGSMPNLAPIPGSMPNLVPIPGSMPNLVPVRGSMPNLVPIPGSMPNLVPMPGSMPNLVPMPGSMPNLVPMPGSMTNLAKTNAGNDKGKGKKSDSNPNLTKLNNTAPNLAPIPGSMPNLVPIPGSMPNLVPMPGSMPNLVPVPGSMPNLAMMPGVVRMGMPQPMTPFMNLAPGMRPFMPMVPMVPMVGSTMNLAQRPRGPFMPVGQMAMPANVKQTQEQKGKNEKQKEQKNAQEKSKSEKKKDDKQHNESKKDKKHKTIAGELKSTEFKEENIFGDEDEDIDIKEFEDDDDDESDYDDESKEKDIPVKLETPSPAKAKKVTEPSPKAIPAKAGTPSKASLASAAQSSPAKVTTPSSTTTAKVTTPSSTTTAKVTTTSSAATAKVTTTSSAATAKVTTTKTDTTTKTTPPKAGEAKVPTTKAGTTTKTTPTSATTAKVTTTKGDTTTKTTPPSATTAKVTTTKADATTKETPPKVTTPKVTTPKVSTTKAETTTQATAPKVQEPKVGAAKSDQAKVNVAKAGGQKTVEAKGTQPTVSEPEVVEPEDNEIPQADNAANKGTALGRSRTRASVGSTNEISTSGDETPSTSSTVDTKQGSSGSNALEISKKKTPNLRRMAIENNLRRTTSSASMKSDDLGSLLSINSVSSSLNEAVNAGDDDESMDGIDEFGSRGSLASELLDDQYKSEDMLSMSIKEHIDVLNNTKYKSVVLCSDLRRAITSCFIALEDRFKTSSENVYVLKSLQELSRNADSITLFNFYHKYVTPTTKNYVSDDVDALIKQKVKMAQKTHKSRFQDTLSYIFGDPNNIFIIFGHSLWFLSFFRSFLKPPHKARNHKMRNSSVVVFNLSKYEDEDGEEQYEIDNESVKVVFKGFEKNVYAKD